jgi:hypothetical protein
MSETRDASTKVGLCADCVHAKRIVSERGSVFWMCQLSAADSRFPKYPRLPVLTCSGYVQKIDGLGLQAKPRKDS